MLWDLDDRNQTCSNTETWIRISRWNVSSSTFWNIGFLQFWCENLNKWPPYRCCFLEVKLSFEILIEKIKAVVLKIEFENRDEFNFIASFGKSIRSRTWRMDENQWLFFQIPQRKCKFFDSRLDERNQISNCWEKSFQMSRPIKIIATFRNFEISGLWRKAKNHQSFFWSTLLYSQGSWFTLSWNNWNFYVWKKELQHNWFSILIAFFGIPPICRAQNDRSNRIFFEVKFFVPEKTKLAKKADTQKLRKKVHFFIFLINFFNRSIKFQIFRLFWKIDGFFMVVFSFR